MLFKTLADKYLDEEIKPDVEKLLDIKMNSPETEIGKRIDNLNNYLCRNIVEIENAISELPTEAECEWRELNEIFLSVIDPK